MIQETFSDFEKCHRRKDSCHHYPSIKRRITLQFQHEVSGKMYSLTSGKRRGALRIGTTQRYKLNNVMIDFEAGRESIVSGLDTVMPRTFTMNDFGDYSFQVLTTLRGWKDLSKVPVIWIYEIYVKGFLESCGDKLSVKEIEILPMGAKVMTYECGIRFLTIIWKEIIILKIDRKNTIWTTAAHAV